MKNIKNISEPFKDLVFEEKEHKYLVKGQPIKRSVSSLIGDFYEHFDSLSVAPFTAKKMGITTEEVLKMWKDINEESKSRGHKVHTFAELYQLNRSLKPSCPQEEAVVKFWNDLPEYIIPVAAELRMYHFKDLYAGTADVILFNTKTQSYIIADYKTNRDLYKNYKGKTMLFPFSHLLDNPLNHYVLQLSFYQILLEQIGVQVKSRVVVWLGLDGNYKLLETEDVTQILKNITWL